MAIKITGRVWSFCLISFFSYDFHWCQTTRSESWNIVELMKTNRYHDLNNLDIQINGKWAILYCHIKIFHEHRENLDPQIWPRSVIEMLKKWWHSKNFLQARINKRYRMSLNTLDDKSSKNLPFWYIKIYINWMGEMIIRVSWKSIHYTKNKSNL